MVNPFVGNKRKLGVMVMLLPVFFISGGCKEQKKAQAPPPEVQVITAETGDVPVYEEWIGALDGFVNAQIRAQVSGYLQSQEYKEGARVEKGGVLFQIDPRPFEASLNQAKAKLAQDKAQKGKTELDVKRFTPLAKEKAISQQELDNAVQADLASDSQLAADEAAIESAQLNLDFTKIISPVDGVAGTALAQVGDLVSPSGGLLTTVSTVDPIRFYFNVNEQSYFSFWQHHINGTNSDLELELLLSDGSVYPKKGKFFFADRQVNPNTGTLQVAGLFPNPDFVLRPGQYGRVRVQTRLERNAVLVPQRAVTELQGSYQIAVVDGDNKAHIKTVKIGPQVGANWVVEEGLNSGDKVIVEGLQKVTQDGTQVAPKPYMTTNNSAGAQTIQSPAASNNVAQSGASRGN